VADAEKFDVFLDAAMTLRRGVDHQPRTCAGETRSTYLATGFYMAHDGEADEIGHGAAAG